MCTFDLHKSTKIKLRLGTRPSKTQKGGFAGRLRVGVYQAECMELVHTHFASGIESNKNSNNFTCQQICLLELY